jgi:hypothetical protein
MHSKEEKPRRKYEKPAVVRLTAPKAAGDCAGGSGDQNCYPAGNSATFLCYTGNAASGPCVSTGSGAEPV